MQSSKEKINPTKKMRKKAAWKMIVLGGLIILVLISLPLPAQGQGQELTERVTFDFREQQEPTAYIGNVAIQSGLTSLLNAERFSKLQFFIHNSDYFAVNSSTGSLSTKKTIDREEVCPNLKICELTFDVTVYEQVDRDNIDLFKVLKCVLRITDINDNSPIFPRESVSLSISEGNKPGVVLRTSGAEDKDTTDENSIQQYRFKDPSDLFTLQVIENPDGSSYLGIQVKEELDREMRDFYQVVIVASDGGFPRRSGSVVINITVTDINDNTPKFKKTSYNESVEENIAFHVPIMRVEAEDKDTGMSAEISYRFSSQVSDDVRDVLYLDEQTGEILAHAKIDYEKVKRFQFVVEAIDHGEPPEKSRVGVTLHVLDVNDNAPQININPSPEGTSISELEPTGKFIAHVSVLDKDDGVNGVVLCNMDDDYFSLEKFYEYASNMYKVVLEKQLDHEQAASHRVTITCTDNGRPALSNTTGFTVDVLDENDNRPEFTEPVYYGEILENTPGKSELVKVVAHDWDSGSFGEISYSLEDKYNGLFVVDSKSGAISVRGPLDRETKSTYDFRVIARDGSPEGLSSSSLVNITVLDENDEPPRFPKPIYFGEVLENQPTGTPVGNVTATDPDDPRKSRFRYSIVSDGSEDSLSFAIDTISGIIKSRTVFDREAKAQYHFLVRVSDPAKPSFYSTCNFTVRVLDDNDHGPVIHKFPNENLTFTVQYSSTVGTTITTILAFDADAATSPNSQLVFLIQSGDPKQLFNLNRYTGSLSLARMVSVKDARSYNLVIRVEDGGDPPLFDTKELIVQINGTAPTGSSGDGLNENILIVIILIGVTVVLGLAILATICLIKKIDRERRASRAAQKKLDDKMYHMKQEDAFNHVAVESTEESNSTSNNLNKRAKKEVSFSFDEDNDSHNTSAGSGHPLTSFRVGGDRSKPNGHAGPGGSRSCHSAPGSGMNIVVGHGDKMGHPTRRSPQDEECHLIEILKKSAEDALSESSGETDPSDSGRGGSEDDSSHRGSGLDPEHGVNSLYPKVHHHQHHSRGCHDNEGYHSSSQQHHHHHHLHPTLSSNRYASLGKGKSPRHYQQSNLTSGPFISPRHSLSSDIESDMSMTGSRTSQSRTDSERSTNPILPPLLPSSNSESISLRSSTPANNNNHSSYASTTPRSRDSRDSNSSRRSQLQHQHQQSGDSPRRLTSATSPYHNLHHHPSNSSSSTSSSSLARSFQGGQPAAGMSGTTYGNSNINNSNNNINNNSNSIPLSSMSVDRLPYGSSASDRSLSSTPSERSSAAAASGVGMPPHHHHHNHPHHHLHWTVPSGFPEEDDRTTTSGSYTINPDELRQEIDQLILQDSIV